MASHRGRRIEDAYGESPPPPAFLGSASVAKRLAPAWPSYRTNVFPQPLWKLFGEHLGEDDGDDQREEEEEEGEEEEKGEQ